MFGRIKNPILLNRNNVDNYDDTEWQYSPGNSTVPMMVHCCILRWFGDGNGADGLCPLSIHQLVEAGGKRLDKTPGDWYTPGNAATAAR